MCPVCQSPAVGDRCTFCRSGLPAGDRAVPQDVVDFLAEALPSAEARRGAFDRGPIRDLVLDGGYRMRMRRDELELTPALELGAWLESLLGELRLRAQSDFELRSQITRRGWSLR